MYAKDLSEPKYEFLIKMRENSGIKHLNCPNALTECSNTIDEVSRILMITIQAEKEKS